MEEIDLLNMYCKEISKFPRLTKQEELSLAHKITAQDSDAAEAKRRFIEANLLLVIKIAKRFTKGALTDRITYGNIGLIKAVEKYDPTRGNRFSTMAVPWIHHYIQRGILSTQVVKTAIEVKDIISPEELNEKNQKIYTGKSAINILEEKEVKYILRYKIFTKLDQHERTVIKHIFGIGTVKEMIMKDIGKRIGYSKQGVHQIKNKAMKKIKIIIEKLSPSQKSALITYLDKHTNNE